MQTAVGHHGLLLRTMMRDYYVTAEVDHETGDLWRDPATGFGNRTPLEKGGEVIVQVPTETLFPG
jgi:hypothetical protein